MSDRHLAPKLRTRNRFAALLAAALFVVVLLSACTRATPSFALSPQNVPPPSAHPSDQQSLEERLNAHMEFLTSDFCGGRQVGTDGAARAAQYVIDEFKNIGLAPAFGDGYTQGYEAGTVSEIVASLEFLDVRGNTTKAFEYGRDFIEVQYPGLGRSTIKGRLVDAGTGGNADLAVVEKGTVVLVRSNQSTLVDLAKRILEKGPVGVLWFDLEGGPDLPPSSAIRKSGASGQPHFIANRISQGCCSELARRTGEVIRLTVNTKPRKAAGFNVVGVLGDPSRAPVVVVSAHRDGLGTALDGTLFPGSIDNASGTAALIEIARALKADPSLAEAVFFVSTDGEEIGLTGAKEFAARLPVKEDRLAYVVNMDCIGVRGAAVMELYTTAENSTVAAVRDLISDGLKGSGFSVKYTTERFGSDHLSFEERGYGTVCIHCVGADMRPYYHGPKDTSEAVDPKVLAAIVKAVSGAIPNAPKAQ